MSSLINRYSSITHQVYIKAWEARIVFLIEEDMSKRASLISRMVKILQGKILRFDSWVGKNHPGEGKATQSVFLPMDNPHGQRSRNGATVHGVTRIRA